MSVCAMGGIESPGNRLRAAFDASRLRRQKLHLVHCDSEVDFGLGGVLAVAPVVALFDLDGGFFSRDDITDERAEEFRIFNAAA